MDNGFNDVAGSAVGFTLRNGDATNSPADYATGARLQFYLAGWQRPITRSLTLRARMTAECR